MRTLKIIAFLGILPLLGTCDRAPEPAETVAETPASGPKTIEIPTATLQIEDAPNPAAPGFDAAGSDRLAIVLADSIVKHHGGRPAWDATRFLRFNFLGIRTLHWDKQEQRVRIDAPRENTVYLLNYGGEEPTGRVRRLGDEVTHPDSLAQYLKRANSIFINDTYWLIHQFKLKDTGVTLKYGGEVRTDPVAKRPSHILDQTFRGVGDTPNNRYRLYVDKVNYRINAWEFFRNADDEEPAIRTPWLEYRPYRGILLSGDRGERFQLKDITVSANMPDRTFTEF
ncbi:MAG: hypothetical protein AAFN92_16640 [Bacteroidota bacterium]